MWNKIILATEKVPKSFQSYFGDIEYVGKYLWAAIILGNYFELISGKFPHAEIILN